MEYKKTYPHEGEMFEPSNQKFEEVVIFVHYYGGHKKNLKKHIQFVNDLGFRAFVFNLFPQPFKGSSSILKNPRFYFSRLGQRWIQEISEVVKLIPDKKIFFCFSFSCNTISLLLPKISQVQAVVFDGGPFAQPFKNSWLYLSHQERVHNIFLRFLTVFFWILLFGLLNLKSKIKKSLSQLPQGFPVLSFQGLSDKLVPPSSIQNILHPQTHLNLTEVQLEKTQHLQGIKSQSDVYQNHLKNFLLKVATFQ